MNESDAPSALLVRRWRKNSQLVTSRIRVRCYADGHLTIDGFAGSPAGLAEVARLISGGAIAALPSESPQDGPLLDNQAAKTAPPIGVGIESEKENVEAAPIAPAVEIQSADPGEFLTARTQRIFQGWAASREVWASYLAWARERQLPAIGRHAFCQALTGAGLRRVRRRPDGSRQQRGWAGVRLQTDGAAQLSLVGA